MMTKITMTLLLVLFGFQLSAQNVSTVPVSSPNSCDGKAYLNWYQATNIQWYYADSMSLIQTGGDSIVGLCYGNYTVIYTDSAGVTTMQDDFLIDTTGTTSGCSNFGANAYVNRHATDSVTCDGEAMVYAFGGLAPYVYQWSNGAMTDFISGLCVGTYNVYAIDANGCVDTLQVYVMDSTQNTLPCSSFGLQVMSTTNASGPSVCDGSASVYAYGAVGTVTYTWSSGGATTPDGQNLCTGYYTVAAVDSNGCSATLTIYVGYDFDSTNVDYLYGWANTTDVSVSGACDGQVYIDVYGGTAPYDVVHTNGMAGQQLTNMCAGAYTAIVTDAIGDTLYVDYIIADPSNVINNGGYPDSTIVDTLGTGVMQNCVLTYFSIDSAFISNINYLAIDSIAVTWTIVDANGSITITTTYTISSGAGVYEFVLQLFCPQRGVSDYLVARDQVYIDPSLLSTKELTAEQVSVYPNPFVSNLNIQFEDNEKSEIQLTDLTGKVVYSQKHGEKNVTLDLEMLAKGQYILQVKNAKGTFFTKLIK